MFLFRSTESVRYANSFDEALTLASGNEIEQVFIIGNVTHLFHYQQTNQQLRSLILVTCVIL